MTTPGQCRVDLTVLPDPARTLRVLRLLRRRRLAVAYVAVTLGGSAVILRDGGFSDGSAVPFVVLPMLLVMMWAGGEWGLRGTARRPDHPLNQTLTFEFSDEGVRASTPQSAAVHHWAAITKVVERAEFWLLYLGRHQVVTVPRAAFTPDQDPVFRRLLAAHVASWRTHD